MNNKEDLTMDQRNQLIREILSNQLKELEEENPEETDPYIQWSLAMIKARNKRGLTQTELAQLSGIGQSDISSLENGLGNPTLKTLQRVADGLDMIIKITLIPKAIERIEVEDPKSDN